ncbi:MAG TPA: hypothetical protein VMZ00_09195 [Sporichthya sp.]|nr:hypothetical protein [Sporichthya sp.]
MSDQFVFVSLRWDGGRGEELFGPWQVRKDGSHLREINQFVTRWQEVEQTNSAEMTVWLPTSPEAYEQRVAST